MSDQRVAANKVVSITYSIVDTHGDEVLEQSDLPVEYLHGSDHGLFIKVEQALEGKQVGDGVAVSLTPREAFGERNSEITFTDKIENVPPEYRKLGAEAEFRNENGESLTMTVTHLDSGTITLDGNHPFAGKSVTFNVKVVAIRDPSSEELLNGVNKQQQPTFH